MLKVRANSNLLVQSFFTDAALQRSYREGALAKSGAQSAKFRSIQAVANPRRSQEPGNWLDQHAHMLLGALLSSNAEGYGSV